MEEALGEHGQPHPQLAANDMVATVDDPELGATTQIGVPIHLLGTPGAIQGPQPMPGRAQRRDLRRARLHATPRSRRSARRSELMHALEGVALVDFGQYLAGPFGPMIIGDLGADVIKVEPVTGDGMRLVGKPFFGCQRGKRDIALDLKTPTGLEIALELVEQADIVHHNMTAGVANRLGIGYDDCKRVNPDVVYCNTYAYGLEGPLAHFGGLDPLYQASAGLEYEAGAGARRQRAALLPLRDVRRRQRDAVGRRRASPRCTTSARTGEGQELWTSLLDGGAMLASDALLVDGEAVPGPRLDQGQHGIGACYRLYETQDGWIQIAAVKESRVDRAVHGARRARARRRRALRGRRPPARAPRGARSAARPRFATKTRARRGRTRSTTPACRTRSRSTRKGGELVLFDADNERLGLVAEYEHPIMGDDAPVRRAHRLLRDARARSTGRRRCVGEHTREILDWLGYADDARSTRSTPTTSSTGPSADYPWTI